MIASVRKCDTEAAIAREIRLDRSGEPEALARAAVYLDTDESSFVTGQVLSVNGGQYMG